MYATRKARIITCVLIVLWTLLYIATATILTVAFPIHQVVLAAWIGGFAAFGLIGCGLCAMIEWIVEGDS